MLELIINGIFTGIGATLGSYYGNKTLHHSEKIKNWFKKIIKYVFNK